MPVLLRLTDVIHWLEDGLQPREPVAVEHWPVSMDVNRVGARRASRLTLVHAFLSVATTR